MDSAPSSTVVVTRIVEDQCSDISAGEVLSAEQPSGLSSEVAAERLRRNGPNELPSSKPRSVAAIAWEVIKEPIFLLLVACGAIYLFLGDRQEALMLLGFVFVVTGISFYQEHKTERTLEALRDLSSPRALVIRGGRSVRIPGREVVKGDLIILAEGDRVPADARVLSSTNLTTDESLLTGESVSVKKTASLKAEGTVRPGGDDLPFVYSGTLVVQGRGLAIVEAIGTHTEIGKIGRALQSVNLERTHLQQETARWVRILAIAGGMLCVVVVLLHGLTRGSWVNGVLSGLTLAMAILPNELPVVLTIFMALGAWRISKRNVLTRRVPVVETLGSASVLCVDKTGTLLSVTRFKIVNRLMRRAIVPFAALTQVFENTGEGIGGRIRSLAVSRRLAAWSSRFRMTMRDHHPFGMEPRFTWFWQDRYACAFRYQVERLLRCKDLMRLFCGHSRSRGGFRYPVVDRRVDTTWKENPFVIR